MCYIFRLISMFSKAFVRSSRAATFLRKGSGLRRYNGAGSPPKAFKRSQSQGNCAAAVTPTVNGSKVWKTTLVGDLVESSFP